MSLDKFQATDAWRNKFKTHLFAERKTPTVARSTVSVVTSQTPQRLSYQLSEELQDILEEKKISPPDIEMPRVRVRDADENDKENIEQFHERLHAALTPSKLKRQPNVVVDNTMMNDSNEALDMTNTSFETLEKMCEKTASDPNSTLFKYLDHGSPAPRHAIRANIVRPRPPTFDEEADALERLLDELNVEETEKRMKDLPSLSDDTQLDDIEAPSRFWENTMTPDALQSISPVKMVGLMRQSTIMEEFSDVSESEASSISYESAMKTCYSSETTGCYETANDTAAGSERAAVKNLSKNSSGRSSSSELFQQRHSRQKFFNDTKKEPEEQTDENPEKSIHLIDFGMSKEEDDPLAESLPLIDLDTTVQGSPEDEKPQEEQQLQEQENESFSNSPSSESAEQAEDEEDYSLEPLKCSLETSTQLVQSIDDDSLVIELSDDDDSVACDKKPTSESTLNRSFTIKSEEPPLDDEKSLHFNDTMEEVEYMMNKGMQYMQAAKENLQQQPEQKSSPMVSVKSHLTPIKKFERYRSPSPMLSSPLTPKTVIAKPKPVNKHVLDIKPFPKLDLFKKPQLNVLKPQNKSAKKQQFSHVVSPIGAYIKKTPTTPLISSVRTELVGTTSSAASSSKAFRKLDCDGRVTPGIGSPRNLQPQQQQKPQNKVCSLPKKAYISSEFKHIVDERTQYTIPGGPKIQRYLVSAMIPAVVRHEGKVKIPENLRTSDMQSAAARRTDDSLADLSVASGDVSVYTIRDAQKF